MFIQFHCLFKEDKVFGIIIEKYQWSLQRLKGKFAVQAVRLFAWAVLGEAAILEAKPSARSEEAHVFTSLNE